MVPKNKRTLLYIIEGLPLFVMNADKMAWKGNRMLQRKFEEALESAGLKKKGKPYDPNSGGARTYADQLTALGLIFYDERFDPTQYRPTSAGQAIMNGAVPLVILQNQLLKMQYPSSYSRRRGVAIAPEFVIRPFSFLLKLLLDPDILWLSKQEIARFVLSAKTELDFESVKERIVKFRQNSRAFLVTAEFMESTVSPRTKIHSHAERIHYLEDKANIFFNYLESVSLVMRPDSKSIIRINEMYADKVKEFLSEERPFLKDPQNEISFQSQYGLAPGRKKGNVSAPTENKAITPQMIKMSLVQNRFFALAKSRLILDLDANLINEIFASTGVPKNEIVQILDKLAADGLTFFEEQYIEMSRSGRDDSYEFEKATQELFEKRLFFTAKHIGQIRPVGRRGGNPDVIFISRAEECCGIVDAKAYKEYSLENDHRNRMLNDYIPNYLEHSEGLPLKTFVYVSGGFGSGFQKALKALIEKSGVSGSGISAKNLLRLARRAKENKLRHGCLLTLFTSNKEINAYDIESLDSEPMDFFKAADV